MDFGETVGATPPSPALDHSMAVAMLKRNNYYTKARGRAVRGGKSNSLTNQPQLFLYDNYADRGPCAFQCACLLLGHVLHNSTVY